jgi:hypothetical protein
MSQTAANEAKAEGMKKEPKAPKEAKEKVAKPPKEKKERTGVSRPRLPKFPDEWVITVLKPNAKREASGLRFNEYRTGMTVKEYVDHMTAPPWNRTVGQVFGDMRWDTEEHRKFVHIGPEVVPVPAPAPQAAPTPATPPATPAA